MLADEGRAWQRWAAPTAAAVFGLRRARCSSSNPASTPRRRPAPGRLPNPSGEGDAGPSFASGVARWGMAPICRRKNSASAKRALEHTVRCRAGTWAWASGRAVGSRGRRAASGGRGRSRQRDGLAPRRARRGNRLVGAHHHVLKHFGGQAQKAFVEPSLDQRGRLDPGQPELSNSSSGRSGAGRATPRSRVAAGCGIQSARCAFNSHSPPAARVGDS